MVLIVRGKLDWLMAMVPSGGSKRDQPTRCPVCEELVEFGDEVWHGKRHRDPVREAEWFATGQSYWAETLRRRRDLWCK